MFHIRDFKFQIKFHQKTPQRASAGMATQNSLQTLQVLHCKGEAEALKNPLFWRFSGDI